MKTTLALTAIAALGYGYLQSQPAQVTEYHEPATPYHTAGDDELFCLVQNIYHEARGEDVQHQAAVAHVTLNRVASAHFPDTICDVVWQSRQFSWTQDGRSDEMTDAASIMTAVDVAIEAMRGESSDPTDGMRFYYAHTKINPPRWAEKPIRVAVLGNHTFLKLER